MSGNNSFRRLLPRGGDADPPPPPPPPPDPVPSAPRAKRHTVVAACEACRGRKTKCDAARPICSACASSGRPCQYSTLPAESRRTATKRTHAEMETEVSALRDAYSTLQRLVHAMRTRNDTDAATILQQLRRGDDVQAIVRHVSDGDLLLQMRVQPEARFRYEFKFPYRAEMPSFLQTPDNDYLRSLVYQVGLTPPDRESDTLGHGMDFRPQYLRPCLAATIADPRLDRVRLSEWTTVSNDDKLMRRLLRLYFLHEHQWLTAFHKDYFLDDMLAGSTRCCSSLLVNVVLAWACHCQHVLQDRVEYWNPQNLGYRFFAEAKRLWEVERMEETSLTTLQAAIIINILYNMYSMDNVGMAYGIQAVTMAKELDLFGTPAVTDSRMRNAYDYTAWCLFCWNNFRDYYFMTPPLIKAPPHRSLPDPDQEPDWYGEFLVQYPGHPTLYSMNFGHVFKERGLLLVFLTRLGAQLRNNGTDSHADASFQPITEYARDLITWYTSLPACLRPAEIVFPSQLNLHLIYHDVMVHICELLRSNPETVATSLPGGDANALLTRSQRSLETIVRLYYLRHGFETADTFLTHHLTVLAFASLGKLKAASPTATASAPEGAEHVTDIPRGLSVDDIRSTLLLAAKGLNDQGRNYYLSYTLFHVIRAQMDQRDIDVLYQFINTRLEASDVCQLRIRHVRAQYPVNIVRMTDNPESKRLENIIKEVAELAVEHSDGDREDGGRS